MSYSIDSVKRFLMVVTNEMIHIKTELTEIDSKLGDGDMGISMEKGALAVRQAVNADTSCNISSLLLQCAMAFNRAAPSTMGTLISGAIMKVGGYCENKQELSFEDATGFPQMMADAIAARGKAREGDKTILDALIPYSVALQKVFRETGDIKAALAAASESARTGMERTKGMVARSGRAKWLGGRNKEYPDGGAVLCWKIARRLAEEYG